MEKESTELVCGPVMATVMHCSRAVQACNIVKHHRDGNALDVCDDMGIMHRVQCHGLLGCISSRKERQTEYVVGS